MIPIEQFVKQVTSWAGVSESAHRFGGRELQLGKAEIGHVHVDGAVDIPFPRAIRDALLKEGLAQEHRWVPDSGWTTFRMRSEDDLKRALCLMRLSYLRYVLKTAANPTEILASEAEQLGLSPQFKLLLKPFIPKSAAPSSGRALSA